MRLALLELRLLLHVLGNWNASLGFNITKHLVKSVVFINLDMGVLLPPPEKCPKKSAVCKLKKFATTFNN